MGSRGYGEGNSTAMRVTAAVIGRIRKRVSTSTRNDSREVLSRIRRFLASHPNSKREMQEIPTPPFSRAVRIASVAAAESKLGFEASQIPTHVSTTIT